MGLSMFLVFSHSCSISMEVKAGLVKIDTKTQTNPPTTIDTTFPTSIGKSLPVLAMKSPRPPSNMAVYASQDVIPQKQPNKIPLFMPCEEALGQVMAKKIGMTPDEINTPMK